MSERVTGGTLRPLAGSATKVKPEANVYAFSPDGNSLLGAFEGALALWTVGSGALARRYAGGGSVVAFSHDGMHFAEGGSESLTLWDAGNGKPVRRFGHGWFRKRHPRGLVGVALTQSGLVHSCTTTFGPDGKPLGVDLWTWDISSGKELRRAQCGTWVNRVVFSADARLLLCLSDEIPRLVDVERGVELFQLATHETQVWSGDISADGAYALTGTGTKGDGYPAPPIHCRLRLWELGARREILRLEEAAEVFDAAFLLNGSLLLSKCNGDRERTIRIWDRNGRELHRYSTDVAIGRVVVSPRGSHVAIATKDGRARLWELPPAGHTTELGSGGR